MDINAKRWIMISMQFERLWVDPNKLRSYVMDHLIEKACFMDEEEVNTWLEENEYKL